MGTGLKHVLDGFIRSMALNFKQATDQHLNGFDKTLFALRNLKTVWKQVLLYCGFFGIILLIAVTNPRAFLIIMEKVTSMALNLCTYRAHPHCRVILTNCSFSAGCIHWYYAGQRAQATTIHLDPAAVAQILFPFAVGSDCIFRIRSGV